ncbi:SDR family oxidoreductase [Mycolicibacterium fortuitum]|uniref:SDR family oxidoreductase n=1 Tax=Mycolicibacterium fortuitum TaxID=1766 RepID=UPI001CE08E5A|nr:SDR family oxidoreductase [Mycolicibacterium fortuitum]MCA4727296.1 SDR family oxidoreductase [Mycolicibacterium fortuitum]
MTRVYPSATGDRIAVVTGASSGIGAAAANVLAHQGFQVVLLARRAELVKTVADEVGGTAVVADITDGDAIAKLADRLERVDVLVNNAGGAKGLEPIAEADLDHWRWMWEVNVLGTLQVTRALLPKLVAPGNGLIVTITSTAAFETYDGGAGYTSAKHAEGALHRTLRGELLGKPERLTEIAPGMVETGFSLVRFGGDQQQADAVYEGMIQLDAEDVAEVIGFVATRPPHVDLDLVVVRPRDQVNATRHVRR